MFKILRHSKLFSITRFHPSLEVKLENISQLHFAKRNYHILNIKQRHYLYSSCNVSNNNKNNSIDLRLKKPISSALLIAKFSTDNLPEPPTVPIPSTVPVESPILQLVQTSANGEPTFASLGLGGWSPVGMVQNSLEFLHVTFDLPWWGVIAIGTLCVRLIVFPLVIMAQRNSATMNNNMPQIQKLQMKMQHARQTGNTFDSARYAQEMMLFMREKGLNPLKSMLPPLMQAPFFISFFLALRRMANCPVESLSTGGLLWFTDLTVPDQFYLLPILTSMTLWITIEIGADSGRLNSNNMGLLKYVLRAIPIVMLPFTIHFPGAILCYWLSTNVISLCQVAILRTPKMREYFKIPKMISHPPEKLPMKPKGLVAGAKDSWTNLKITKEMEDRLRVDEMIFNKAGQGPLQKTYKYDPTKHLSAISAKKSDS